MGKTVRRWALDDMCDIGHNESWFGAMAQKGVHLKKYGRMSIHFERGEPKNTKYRAEILKGRPTEEQIELYRECGWEYVTNNRFMTIFSADGNAAVTELHTDPVEQGYTLEAPCKSARNNFILMTIAVTVMALMIVSVPLFSPEPVYTMVTGIAVQQFGLLAVYLYLYFIVFNNYRTLRRLKDGLLAGIPIRHDLPYRAHRAVTGSAALFGILIAVCTVIIPVVSLVKNDHFALPETVGSLPILRLSEVEQNPDLVREVRLDQKNFDRGNSVRYEWSILAPVQYEAREGGRVPGSKWGDGSGEYSPSLNTWYYELTFASMAEPFMYDLMHRYAYRYDRLGVSEITTPLFDEVQFGKNNNSGSSLYARKGNRVIFIIYNGTASLESLLPLLADKFAL